MLNTSSDTTFGDTISYFIQYYSLVFMTNIKLKRKTPIAKSTY